MKLDKEQLFGITLMIIGSFIAADGITNGKFSYTAMGFVLFGFAIYLWVESRELPVSEDERDDIEDHEKSCAGYLKIQETPVNKG